MAPQQKLEKRMLDRRSRSDKGKLLYAGEQNSVLTSLAGLALTVVSFGVYRRKKVK